MNSGVRKFNHLIKGKWVDFSLKVFLSKYLTQPCLFEISVCKIRLFQCIFCCSWEIGNMYHSWKRFYNPFILWRPPTLPIPLFKFFSICPCSFCCLASLTEWVIEPHSICYILLNGIMVQHIRPWYISTIRTFPWVLCNKSLVNQGVN